MKFQQLIVMTPRRRILAGLFALCTLIYQFNLNAQPVETSQADSSLSSPGISGSGLSKPVSSKSALSNYSLGVEAYQQGEFRRAFDAWSLGAYEGDVEAQYNLGVLFLEGRGVTRNVEQARNWFLKAAQKQHLEALYNLGHMALGGMGMDKDTGAALDWWQQAAEGGYPQAQFNYGRALYLGVGGRKDKPAGLALIRSAAVQQDQRAQKFLDQNAANQPGKSEQVAMVEVEPTPLIVLDKSLKQTPNPKPVDPVEIIEQSPPEVANYQSGRAKPVIVRDSTQVRNDYFLRTVAQPVPIFALPDLSSQLDTLRPRILVKVLEIKADKLKIEVVTGLSAWVKQVDLEQRDGLAKARLSGVTMYESPDGSPLGELPKSIGLRILRQQGAWLNLNVLQHIYGWIDARSLAYSGESDLQLRRAWAQQLSTLNGRPLSLEKVSMPQVVIERSDQPGKSPLVLAPDTVAVAPVSLAQPQPQSQPSENVATGINDNTWLFTQARGAYVVHMFTSLDQSKAREIAAMPRYRSEAKLYTTQVKQETWSFLLLGPYADIETAKVARNRLPAYLAKGARIRSITLIAENRCKKRYQLSEDEARGLDAFCIE